MLFELCGQDINEYQVAKTFDVLPISHKQRENVIDESIISRLCKFY